MSSKQARFGPIHVNGWNILVHWPHLFEVLKHRLAGTSRPAPAPITVEVNPMDYCNHSCTWCFTASHREADRMDRSVLLNLIEELGAGETKSVHFAGGGESTIFKNLVRSRSSQVTSSLSSDSILRQASSLGLTAGMISNGSMLKELDLDELVSDLAWIRFSIDAGTELRYRLTHKPKGHTLNDVHEGIAELVRKRGRRRSPSIGASFVVEANGESLRREVERFCSNMAMLGVDYVQIKPENANRGGESVEFLESLHGGIEDALAARPTFAMLNAPYESTENSDYCWYSYLGPVVGATGEAYVCCYTYGQEEFRFGQLGEGNSFQDLWTSDYRKEVVDRIDPRSCSSCRHSTANRLIERIFRLGPDSWQLIGRAIDLVRSGKSAAEIELDGDLEWLRNGLVQLENLRRGGLNGMLDYPTYRPSLFIGFDHAS